MTNTAFSRDREDERPGTGTKRPYSISLDDCVQGDVLHFDLKVSSPSSDNFQVWVGSSDCTQEQERENTTAQCWLVHSAPAEEISFTVDIPVRNIVARKRPQENPGSGVYAATEADCKNVWEGSVSLYFMYVNDLGAVKSHTIWKDTDVDLKGPTAPSNVEASGTEQGVELEWEASNSTDLLGYRFYCLPNEGTVASKPNGGSEGGAGGADNGGTSNTDAGVPRRADTVSPTAADAGGLGCGAVGLVPGTVPTSLKPCGKEESSLATNGRTKGQTNGVSYAVAVAAIDELGNPGPLSNVVCDTPQNVTSFIETYDKAGGAGATGICSVSQLGSIAGGGPGQAYFGLLLLAGLFLRRTRTASLTRLSSHAPTSSQH